MSRVSSRAPSNLAARMGRWSAHHRKTAIFGWFALVIAAFAVGTSIAFSHTAFLLEPVGYWRGAVGFLLFAIALRLMDGRP